MVIVPKAYTKKYLEENSSIVFKDREFIVEVEKGTNSEDSTLRFKVGDGVRPYYSLPYVSSLYALFPNIKLCNVDYSKELSISFEGCVDDCLP